MRALIFVTALCCFLLVACASPIDRQWEDMQTILEIREHLR